MRQDRHGFSLVELAAITATAVAVGAGGMLTIQPGGKKSGPALTPRQAKDAAQVRGIHQGMVVWAQNHKDRYPLPSLVDRLDHTVAAKGRAKDTTANIYSMLVYVGMLSTEILVSPAESNPNVRPNQTYKFENPTTAVDPSKALWDPALVAVLDGSKKGHISYAHLQPSGERSKRWSNTFSSTEMIVGTRGPEIASVAYSDAGDATPKFAKPGSLSLKQHGDGTVWSGLQCFNDNAVHFSKLSLASGKPIRPTKDTAYFGKGSNRHADLWAYDEPDDEKSGNTYLGIFTAAGGTPKDYKAIWD